MVIIVCDFTFGDFWETKILFSVVIFPLVLIMLVVAGLMYVALPVLVIAGIVVFLLGRR